MPSDLRTGTGPDGHDEDQWADVYEAAADSSDDSFAVASELEAGQRWTEAANPSLFQDARIGVCECCESDEKPVVTFADEFGTTLCEGCYLACVGLACVGQVSYGRE